MYNIIRWDGVYVCRRSTKALSDPSCPKLFDNRSGAVCDCVKTPETLITFLKTGTAVESVIPYV